MSGPNWDKAWATDDPAQYWASEYQKLAAQLSAAKAALKPFAALYQSHLYGKFDNQPVFGINDATITVGELRDAVIVVKGSL